MAPTQRQLETALRRTVEHLPDCERIVRVALNRLSLDLSVVEAKVIWSEHSDTLCAGWLYLPEKDSLLAQTIEAWVAGRLEDYDAT